MLTADQLAKLPDLLASLKKRAQDPIACCDDAKTAVAIAEDLLAEVKQLKVQASNYAYQRDEARRERDQAIAHDRQPYPTAWAYERACAALEKHRQRADRLHEVMGEVLSWIESGSGLVSDLRLLVGKAIEDDEQARDRKPDGNAYIETAPAVKEPRSQHRCPDCHEPTVYAAFSGGKEWYCKPCDNQGMYPEDAAPRRLQMLADGRTDELRQEMREEIAKRKADGAPVDADLDGDRSALARAEELR